MKCDDPLCRGKDHHGDHGLWGLHGGYDGNSFWHSKRLFDNQLWRFVYEMSRVGSRPRTVTTKFIERLEQLKVRNEKQIQ